MHGAQPSLPLKFPFGLARELHPKIGLDDFAGCGCALIAEGVGGGQSPVSLLTGCQFELRLANFGDVEESTSRPARLSTRIVEDLALVSQPADRAVAPDDPEFVVGRAAFHYESLS